MNRTFSKHVAKDEGDGRQPWLGHLGKGMNDADFQESDPSTKVKSDSFLGCAVPIFV